MCYAGTKKVLRLFANLFCAKRLLDWNARAGFNTANSFFFNECQAFLLMANDMPLFLLGIPIFPLPLPVLLLLLPPLLLLVILVLPRATYYYYN